jgi:periplasmic divalent cation tolerance protein
MPTMSTAVIVLTNVPSPALARDIARHLVENRLAACVNIMPAMQSVYRWQEQVEQAEEVALIIKTTSERYADVEQAIAAMHPYDVPEIVALPITDGMPGYLAWITQEVRKDIDV